MEFRRVLFRSRERIFNDIIDSADLVVPGLKENLFPWARYNGTDQPWIVGKLLFNQTNSFSIAHPNFKRQINQVITIKPSYDMFKHPVIISILDIVSADKQADFCLIGQRD